MQTEIKRINEALNWWHNLSDGQQFEVSDKYELASIVNDISNEDILTIYTAEHPPLEVKEGEHQIARLVDYCFQNIDADLLNANQEFHRLVSIRHHLNNFEGTNRIVQAVNNFDAMLNLLNDFDRCFDNKINIGKESAYHYQLKSLLASINKETV